LTGGIQPEGGVEEGLVMRNWGGGGGCWGAANLKRGKGNRTPSSWLKKRTGGGAATLAEQCKKSRMSGRGNKGYRGSQKRGEKIHSVTGKGKEDSYGVRGTLKPGRLVEGGPKKRRRKRGVAVCQGKKSRLGYRFKKKRKKEHTDADLPGRWGGEKKNVYLSGKGRGFRSKNFGQKNCTTREKGSWGLGDGGRGGGDITIGIINQKFWSEKKCHIGLEDRGVSKVQYSFGRGTQRKSVPRNQGKTGPF